MERTAVLGALLLIAGCAGGAAPTEPAAPAGPRRGYALLHQLLEQEQHVAKLLVVKDETDALDRVIGDIADTTARAREDLEDLAGAAPAVALEDTGLPADERSARESIAAARRDRLLATSGREFERELLLSQNEALTYGAALADVLSRSEANPERLAFVRRLWRDLTRLQRDVVALIR
jgi:hypothetical protein